MSGIVSIGQDRWSYQSWAFHWVVGFLIERVADQEVARQLQEIDGNNLKWVAVDDFPSCNLQILESLAYELIPITKSRLPLDMPDRELAVARLAELADLALSHLPNAGRMAAMDLRLVGQTVIAIEFGFTVNISFSDRGGLTLESPFVFVRAESQIEVDPDKLSNSQTEALNGLVGLEVIRAEASDGGDLRVELSDSTTISATADGQYEAWNVSGAKGFKVVCMPSGELAVWSPRE